MDYFQLVKSNEDTNYFYKAIVSPLIWIAQAEKAPSLRLPTWWVLIERRLTTIQSTSGRGEPDPLQVITAFSPSHTVKLTWLTLISGKSGDAKSKHKTLYQTDVQSTIELQNTFIKEDTEIILLLFLSFQCYNIACGWPLKTQPLCIYSSVNKEICCSYPVEIKLRVQPGVQCA